MTSNVARIVTLADRTTSQGDARRAYQTAQRFSGGRTISAPALQANA
jgi:hypothetical protein